MFKWENVYALAVVWVVGASTLISFYYRWRKTQVERSLAHSTILLSESGVWIRHSAYSLFGIGMTWLKGDVYLTADDIVVIHYLPVLIITDAIRMYQPHIQIALRHGVQARREGVSSRLEPTDPICEHRGGLRVKARKGLVKQALRLSVREPDRWISEVERVSNQHRP